MIHGSCLTNISAVILLSNINRTSAFMQQCAVWWVKRDIRLADNQALTAAVASGLPVVPVYLFEPSLLFVREASSTHAYAQRSAVVELQWALRALGSDLLCLHAECDQAFGMLAEHIVIRHVFSQQETGTESTYARDRDMAGWFASHGIQWDEVSQGGVVRNHRGRSVRSRHRDDYYGQLPLPAPRRLRPLEAPLKALAVKPVPTMAGLGFTSGGHSLQRTSELEATSILSGFLRSRSKGYRYSISSPLTAFTSGSRLSAHLAWGTISSRTVLQAVTVQRKSATTVSRNRDLAAFASRIHWRDHFMQRLELHPEMEFHPLNPLFRDLPYEDDYHKLALFLSGETGFPLVDASMRCLGKTGFLNFRMRAMVTSFATHALRLDWRTVNAPLARLMYDYEPGIHISQLQMQSGVTGFNTLRVYSPAKQLAEQDPDAVFTKRWVPELVDVPTDSMLSVKNGRVPGYIEPIVDFAAETKVMKDALYALKKSDENGLLIPKILQRVR